MRETKTEVQLKAKATNWLLSALIGVVSWIGRQHQAALEKISNDLQQVSTTLQVHESRLAVIERVNVEQGNKLETTLLGLARLEGKPEEFYEYPKRKK